jgi:hypothetical protein
MAENPTDPNNVDTGGGAYVAGDVQAGGDVVLRDKITIQYGNLSAEDIRERKKQEKLLKNVEDFWIRGVLDTSLRQHTLLQLNLEEAPGLVPSPWSAVIDLPGADPQAAQAPGLLPAYEKTGGALLVAGAGGSGKTTSLIQLAAELCAQAWRDPTRSIPVILHLSSWGRKQTSLVKWAAEEINHFYSVPRQMGERWIEQDALVLLLDGLDETPLERRQDCVAEINRFREHHGLTGLVVCSRLAEYQVIGLQLQLNGAVVLRPLDQEQVDTYLAGPDPALRALSAAVRQDPALAELVKTPLMLGVLVTAYQGAPPETLQLGQQNAETWRRRLIETYVRRMFERRGARYQGRETTILKQLGHVARKLGETNQPVFFVENLHPGWLVNRLTRLGYYLTSRLLIFLIIGLILALNFSISGSGSPAGTLGLLSMAIPAGVISGFIRWGLPRSPKGPVSRRLVRLLSPNIESIAFGVTMLIAYVLVVANVPEMGTPLTLFSFLVFAVLASIVLRYILPTADLSDDIHVVESMQWSWKSARKGILVGAVFGFLFSIGTMVVFPESAGSTISGIGYSLLLSLLVYVVPIVGIFCLAAGLNGRRIEEKIRLNQGIYLAARNMGLTVLLLGAGGGVLLLCIFLLFRYFGARFHIGQTVLVIILPLALAGALRNGALTILQHYLVRLALWIERTLPLDLLPLLDAASDLLLMRRAGGGYIFLHRMFMEYFSV